MANTVIGSGISIDGEIRGEEALVIQGSVKGKVAVTGDLLVDAGATVDADIEGKSIAVAGRLTGNVHASDRVDVKADARVIGDIKSPRISIADGASFKGNIDMDV